MNTNDWYYSPVLWAAQHKIVSGYPDGSYKGSQALNREQLVTILHNYAIYKGDDVSKTSDLAGYKDAAKVSDYARPALAWAVGSGIITGTSTDTLDPQGIANRAQMAGVLERFTSR